MTDGGQIDTKFQIDLAVGILLAAITLAVIISVVNEGSATESFSLLMMGMMLGAIVPPFVAVFYVWLRHRTVTQKFLWIYAALTFAMLLMASLLSGLRPFTGS